MGCCLEIGWNGEVDGVRVHGLGGTAGVSLLLRLCPPNQMED
jgi:hypothetical protein